MVMDYLAKGFNGRLQVLLVERPKVKSSLRVSSVLVVRTETIPSKAPEYEFE